jgi:hypothetical protein
MNSSFFFCRLRWIIQHFFKSSGCIVLVLSSIPVFVSGCYQLTVSSGISHLDEANLKTPEKCDVAREWPSQNTPRIHLIAVSNCYAEGPVTVKILSPEESAAVGQVNISLYSDRETLFLSPAFPAPRHKNAVVDISIRADCGGHSASAVTRCKMP